MRVVVSGACPAVTALLGMDPDGPGAEVLAVATSGLSEVINKG